MGGHRLISHSILGLFIFGYLSKLGLMRLGSILLVDMNIVWIAFMVGVVSHLLADMLTKEGVPLLFPLPWEIGIPPFRFLRIKTGGLIEKSVVFPGLMLASGAMMTNGYDKILEFLKSL
jgi:inner membrane protein